MLPPDRASGARAFRRSTADSLRRINASAQLQPRFLGFGVIGCHPHLPLSQSSELLAGRSLLPAGRYPEPPGSGVTSPAHGHRTRSRHSIDSYFNNGGALPAGFINLFNLSGAPLANALTQLDGEDATGAQKSAFQLMQDFLNLLLDPSADGQGGGAGGQVSQFAPEQDSSLPPDIALAYAHALRQKPPPSAQPRPQDFEQRWSAWASGFGGSGTTDGNASAGSNNVTATDYGYAAGLTYHLTPATSYGFALAGGGTNWNLAQSLGSGRSDSFQSGVYSTTHFGPAYLSGALVFANHWFTTNRIAMGDNLTANFQGQSYAARGEAGYRYGLPITGTIVGVTPYAALQVQDFHTPSYSETDLSGGGFGLTYNAVNATDTRSELGARFDNLTVWNGMPLVLRGRLAWAHDWVSDPALGAAFQALPGSSFTVTARRHRRTARSPRRARSCIYPRTGRRWRNSTASSAPARRPMPAPAR
jgi:hypothetical protein